MGWVGPGASPRAESTAAASAFRAALILPIIDGPGRGFGGITLLAGRVPMLGIGDGGGIVSAAGPACDFARGCTLELAGGIVLLVANPAMMGDVTGHWQLLDWLLPAYVVPGTLVIAAIRHPAPAEAQ
jgi:hypothetical protein